MFETRKQTTIFDDTKKEKVSFQTQNDLDTSAASDVSVLPNRIRGNYLSKCRTNHLKTNLYKVQLDYKRKISIFSVKINPNIANDSTRKINSMLNSVRKQLSQYIGSDYVICGRTIFTSQDKLKIKEQVKTSVVFDGEKYTIVLKKVKQVDMSLINSHHKKENLLPLNFLNNLVKRFFSDMGYVQIGTCGKYVNPASRQVMPNSGLIMFNGYQAAISLLQNGFYLRVDSLSRVVQDKTVLQLINSIYKSNSHMSKQQKRAQVKQQLIGLTVVANYGNSRCWRISDVEFDIDLKNHRIGDQNSPTFAQYYYKNYSLHIKNPKQPLLKAKINGLKTKGFALLVPQFLLLSGIPQSFDQRRRRDISEKTILPPSDKSKRIEQLMLDLNNQNHLFTPNKISKSLGISISKQSEIVQAISLNPPVLQLGRQSVQQNRVANFAIFNKQLYSTSICMKIAAIIPDDYDFSQIQKLFASTCKNLGLKYDFCVIKINYRDQKNNQNTLQSLIEDKNQKLADRNLNWFILPGNQKNLYTFIKKNSSDKSKGKLTQVSLTSTLGKKGFASILTKTLIQIACKIGNIAWSPQISKSFSKNSFMIMGIDTAKDIQNKKMSVLSYCCSLDKNSTKFHSKYVYQPSSLGFNSKIKDAVADCLMAYAQANNQFPNQLILLSNGCSFSEKDNIIFNEIADIKAFLANTLSKHQIKLTYMTVDKSSKQKFFFNPKGIINPSYGTLINSKVVGKNYDFYMISQHCNRGTVKPIHYEVIYTDSEIQQGILQEFLYSQCFNYMNWSGSVRVPGVLQYATKLSKLASQHLNKQMECEKLENLLFYI